jgi:two-component system heavy metal sensor histidine kinase CusS
VSSNSIALRLSGMFTGGAAGVPADRRALYQQVDKAWACCPRPNWMRATACSNPPVNRYGTPEHWVKINNKLKLLGEEDKRTFWVVSGDPHYEYGNLTRRSAPSPKGRWACATCNCRISLIH